MLLAGVVSVAETTADSCGQENVLNRLDLAAFRTYNAAVLSGFVIFFFHQERQFVARYVTNERFLMRMDGN